MIDIDGEPWFPAKDACDMLGLKYPTKAVKDHCHEGDSMMVAKSNVTAGQISFPNRGLLCVNESGFYILVFESKMDQARTFRHWVTSTVLPSAPS